VKCRETASVGQPNYSSPATHSKPSKERTEKNRRKGGTRKKTKGTGRYRKKKLEGKTQGKEKQRTAGGKTGEEKGRTAGTERRDSGKKVEGKAEESHRSALPLSSSLQKNKRMTLNQRLLTTGITIVYFPSSQN
jgi:hypothetical protein